MKLLALITTALTMFLSVLDGQPQPWVSAYYAGWMQDYLLPADIDFGAVTHIMHFSIEPSNGPNLSGEANGITRTTSAAIVKAAHAAGRKVLITCGGSGDDGEFVAATTAANREAFIRNLVSFILDNG